MDFTMIIQIEIGLVVVVFAYLLWKNNKKIEKTAEELKKYLSEQDLDSQLSDILSDDADPKKSYELGQKLLRYIKIKFAMKSHTYSDMIKEVKDRADISAPIREQLADLFHDMIILSYKTDLISHNEKDRLRSKIKVVIKKIEHM